MSLSRTAILLLLTAFGIASARSVSVPGFLVRPGAASRIGSDELEGVAQRVRGVVAEYDPGWVVLGPTNLQKVVEDKGLVYADVLSAAADGASDLKVAQLIGAEFHIAGDATIQGTRLVVGLQMFQVSDGSLLASTAIEGATTDRILDELPAQVVRFLDRAMDIRDEARRIADSVAGRKPAVDSNGAFLSLSAKDARSGRALAADILFDGRRRGATPWLGRIPAKVREIRLVVPGYVDALVDERPSRGQTISVEKQLALRPDSGARAVDPRDGRSYPTVRIKGQTWLAANLAFRAKGSTCYRGDSASCDAFGRLYDYEEAIRACPAGWHLPSDGEWKRLEESVGVDAGHQLKSAQWDGSGRSGFAALAAGYQDKEGQFVGVGSTTAFWTSSEFDAARAWQRQLGSEYFDLNRALGFRASRLSVRCVKDAM